MTSFSNHDGVVQKALDEISERPLARHFNIGVAVPRGTLKLESEQLEKTISSLCQLQVPVLGNKRKKANPVFHALWPDTIESKCGHAEPLKYEINRTCNGDHQHQIIV